MLAFVRNIVLAGGIILAASAAQAEEEPMTDDAEIVLDKIYALVTGEDGKEKLRDFLRVIYAAGRKEGIASCAQPSPEQDGAEK